MNKINILFIDEDKKSIEISKKIFSDFKEFKIEYETSPIVAFEKYNNNKDKYDIVITDIIFSGLNKIELIKKIREINEEQCIVILSLMEDKDTLIKAIELKINSFIQKPINKAKFIQKINQSIKTIKSNREKLLLFHLMNQYKETIDEGAIVSKANPKGIITFVNNKFCEISGYKREELIGKNHNIVRHPDMPKKEFMKMWESIKNGKTWHGEVKNKRKDGTVYWVKATIKPIVDNNGKIIEYIGIRTDITQQKQIEEYFEQKLNITNEKFDNALNLSNQYEICIDSKNAILRTDPNNIITYANDKFCNYSGYTKEELIGKNCFELRDDKHKKNGDCKKVIEKLSKNKLVSMIFKNKSKDGNPFYMDTVIYPIQDTKGNIIEFLQLMNDITPIIKLNKEIEETQKEVVLKMGAIGETRSKETGHHVKRVSEYSYLLAILAGLSIKEAELIKLASPMHDIGKVGIPDSILNKPGPLTDEEFDIMKTHTKIGYNMLNSSDRKILRTSAIIAHEHHERWDGKGYPNGLKGEDIHIFGRITSICDVFDALGHDRCYKKAWPIEKIISLFEKEKGKQFDPNLMDLFLNNIEYFLEIKKKYED